MEPVRVGVIGCGVMGRIHVKAGNASPAVDVVAVADVRRDLAEGLAAQYNVPRIYEDGMELIRDDSVEAVVLALPAGLRHPFAMEAFARGKHVLVEKPVALNAGQVRDMIDAKKDLVGACCSARFRFFESARAAEEVLQSGALGALRVIRCRGIFAAGEPPKNPPPAWRLSRALNGGGILSNWGCYDLDYLLGVTGWSVVPQSVFAAAWTVPAALRHYVAEGSDAESHVTALIRCEGDLVLQIERAEFVVGKSQSEWQIIGEEGSLQLMATPGVGKENVVYTLEATTGSTSRVIWHGDETWEYAHSQPIDDFAKAIREGREPKTSLERALTVQRITDAIYRSAREGKEVLFETV